uniref:Mast cell immunoglobulin like receptor 1 n=1 Tax=Microcebus murinus TaxID=30608 RepID=A0A8B7F5G1_MICMU|nr:allergin-1 [Microcebus murinus]
MRSRLNTLLFWGTFSSVTFQNAVLDRETTKIDELPSPRLYSETNVVMKGQNVSLFCSNENKSLQITYSLFRADKYLGTQSGTGEPVIFNVNISEAPDLGPYKCKAEVLQCVRYSREFNFTIVDPVTAPELSITVTQTETERHVTLLCISANGSLPISYTFFEKDVTISPAISKNRREPARFNFTKKNSGEEEEYRCEARNSLPNHTKYSLPVTVTSTGGGGCPFCLQLLLPGLLLLLMVTVLILALWILPKYKARKAMRDNVQRTAEDCREVGIYANVSNHQADGASVPGMEPRQCVCTAPDGAGDSQEIHYATPMFLEVAPTEQEAYNDCKPGYVYSELVF